MNKGQKRFLTGVLAVVLAVVMVITYMPLTSYAKGNSDIQQNEETQKATAVKSASIRLTGSSLGNLEMNVGETATHLSYPRLGFNCLYDGTIIAVATMSEYGDCYGGADDGSVVKAISQGYSGSKDEYIQTTLKGLKGGVTSYEISTSVHMIKSGSAVCPNCGTRWGTDANRWIDYTDTWTVTVYDTFVLNYNANGGKGSGKVTQRAAQEYYTFSNVPEPTRDGYEFLGWSTNSNATKADSDALTVGPSPNNTKTVYAVWKPCDHDNIDYVDNENGTHDGTCSDCGKLVVDDEKHQFENGTCIKCGAEEPKKPCTHTNVTYTDNGDGTHDGVCDDCNKVVVDDEAHEFVNGVCTKCGAEEPKKPCTHTNVTYKDNGDGTHDGVCNDCNKVVVDDEAHELVNGVCTKCGAEEKKDPGKDPVDPNPTTPGGIDVPTNPEEPDKPGPTPVYPPSNPNPNPNPTPVVPMPTPIPPVYPNIPKPINPDQILPRPEVPDRSEEDSDFVETFVTEEEKIKAEEKQDKTNVADKSEEDKQHIIPKTGEDETRGIVATAGIVAISCLVAIFTMLLKRRRNKKL